MRFRLRNCREPTVDMNSEFFVPSGDPEHEKYIRSTVNHPSTEEEYRVLAATDLNLIASSPTDTSKVLRLKRSLIKLLLAIVVVAVVYTVGGHVLQQLKMWDPCSKRFSYRKTYSVDSYGGGLVLQCTKKEDYVCLVPGFQGEKTSTGWDLTGAGCDDSVLTHHHDSRRH